jgi:hypothetical protein
MQQHYPDFWQTLLGNGSLGAFLAYLVIAYFAATASLLFEASNRDISSSNTPIKWSTKFLLAANWLRLLANLLAIPLLIRMEYEYIDMKWMILIVIAEGILIDRAFMVLKNIGVLATDKFASRIADKVAKDDLIITKNNKNANTEIT